MKNRVVDDRIELNLDWIKGLRLWIYEHRKTIFKVTCKGMIIFSIGSSISMLITGIIPMIQFFFEYIVPSYQELT